MSAPQLRTARMAPSDGRPLRQFPVGRACILCGATLSRYNGSRFCFIHQPKNFRVPASRI